LGVEQFRTLLRPRRRVALDTSIFIYQVEANPKYYALSDVVFEWLEKQGNVAVTSTLSLTELLVPVYREGNEKRIQTYYGLFRTFPSLAWIPPDLEIADIAARLRAAYGLKTPDAIHAATAIYTGVSVFLTNDPLFKRVKELESLVLGEVL
jgi:predicted nucleic acid-binding protein